MWVPFVITPIHNPDPNCAIRNPVRHSDLTSFGEKYELRDVHFVKAGNPSVESQNSFFFLYFL